MDQCGSFQESVETSKWFEGNNLKMPPEIKSCIASICLFMLINSEVNTCRLHHILLVASNWVWMLDTSTHWQPSTVQEGRQKTTFPPSWRFQTCSGATWTDSSCSPGKVPRYVPHFFPQQQNHEVLELKTEKKRGMYIQVFWSCKSLSRKRSFYSTHPNSIA